MFKLGKLEFAVESADLCAGFSDAGMLEFDHLDKEKKPKIMWVLEIDMEYGDFVTESAQQEAEEEGEEPFYESVPPVLYHNNGFRMDVKSWKDLEGMSKTWESDCNEDGEEAGSLYVFEHEDLTSGRIEFLKREGDVFRVRWSGTANVFWDDEYDTDVPFEFEGDVKFSGLQASCIDVTDLDGVKAVLSEYIDMSEFEFGSERTYEFHSSEEGMKTVHEFKFVPKL